MSRLLCWLAAFVLRALSITLAITSGLALVTAGERVAFAAWLGLWCGICAAVFARMVARELEGDPWWR